VTYEKAGEFLAREDNVITKKVNVSFINAKQGTTVDFVYKL